MYRIDNDTAAVALPASTAPGPNPDAYFTDGNPGGGVPATVVDAEWLNSVQEEISGVIEGAGLTLDKADASQLLAAIQLLATPAVGSIVGRGYVENATASTITSTIPVDSTIPQSGEGDQVLSLAYAAASNTNRLRITVNLHLKRPSAPGVTAVFSSASANAIAAKLVDAPAGSTPETIVFEIVPGTTASRTYSVRVGTNSGTVYVNQDAGGNTLGGVIRSTMVIEEIKAV